METRPPSPTDTRYRQKQKNRDRERSPSVLDLTVEPLQDTEPKVRGLTTGRSRPRGSAENPEPTVVQARDS